MAIAVSLASVFISTQIFSQSQEEILRDLREENVPFKDKELYPKDVYLEKLIAIYLAVGTDLEKKEDRRSRREIEDNADKRILRE